jgi:hypothetical protein
VELAGGGRALSVFAMVTEGAGGTIGC